MRTLAFFAILAGAAVQAVQQGHLPVAVRYDGCSKTPKLCTDPVVLRGSQTTLTYLCPETKTPTATITTTSTTTTTTTTTVIGSAAPVTSSGHTKTPTTTITTTLTTTETVIGGTATTLVSTSDGVVPTSEVLTNTTTVHSTMQVTETETVVKTTACSVSPLKPTVITASFTAAPLSDVKPTWSEFKNTSSVKLSSSEPVPTKEPPLVMALTSFNLFPPHSVAESSSTASLDSTTYSVPLTNSTSSYSGYAFPTMNVMRGARSTETVTTTAAVVTATGTGMAGESRVSLVTLFLSIMAIILIF